MNDMNEYILDLMISAGIDPKNQDYVGKELEKTLMTRILLKFALKMDAEQHTRLEKALSLGDANAFWKTCEEVPDYENYFNSILEEFEREYLSHF